MINHSFAGALALALVLTACSGATSGDEQLNEAQTAAASDRTVYPARGTVTEIADGQLRISHGPVAELGWPAMTMSFAVTSPELARGVGVGDRVQFAFREDGGGYTLTSLTKAP